MTGRYNDRMTDRTRTGELIVVGAGPIGIELAVEARRAGLSVIHLEKGQIGQTMLGIFPPRMRWFSSNDRIAIAGIPIQTTDQSKCTREQYLAYLRQVVRHYDLAIRTYEPVTGIAKQADGPFTITTAPACGQRTYRAPAVVLATGDTHWPNKLGVPGEDAPHVHSRLDEPHRYFGCRLLVVGGKNSAVESALRCAHAGAKVTLSYRRDRFDDKSVKYWLLPELHNRIKQGEIDCCYRTQPVRITPTAVTLKNLEDDTTFDVPADFVLVQIGYEADMSLFEMAGVSLHGDNRMPKFDRRTMQTDVPGLYVAGTASAGTQTRYRVFLENCHVHTQRIVAHLTGHSAPADGADQALPES